MKNSKSYKISYTTKGETKNESRSELVQSLLEPKENIAFLDAEFNAGMIYSSGEKINEIISVGLVICDPDFKELKQYYSLVRMISKVPVFPVIKEMTGITDEMLVGQPSFIQVSNEISDLLNEYQVRKIYTWGAADKHSLLMEKSLVKRHSESRSKDVRWGYIDMCTDISGVVSTQLLGVRGGLAINMENLLFLCEIDRVHEHNALSDAVDLYQCIRELKKHYPLSEQDKEFLEKRELVNQYYQEKSTYNSFRRFRSTSKGSDLYGKWGEEELSTDMRIRALEDDIKFLKGEIPYNHEFDTIQEFFTKKSLE